MLPTGMTFYRLKYFVFNTNKRFYSTVNGKLHIAIVGAGPAGFYTAQQICKNVPDVNVDLFEKYPVPFGLVRYGVAPDHPDVKNVTNTFTQIAENNRVKFYGNMIFGTNLSLTDLKKSYPAIILSYGCSEDKTFNIPGENLNGVMSASKFINWYNGAPGFENLQVNLNTKSCVILGQGNVAIDVARILLSPISDLEKTDITDYSIKKLSQSEIKKVYLVGRRGPIQASFTPAEFREISKLSKCQLLLKKDDFNHIKENMKDIPRPKKRLTELQVQKVSEEQYDRLNPDVEKELHIIYKRSPIKFVEDPSDAGSVKSILFSINKLQNEMDLKAKAIATEETECIETSLVIKSIGYRGVQLDPDMPFDKDRGVIPNKSGRVPGLPGLYCSGWLKTGPVGVLASTMNNAFETGKSIVEDIKSGMLNWNKDFEDNRNKLLEEFKDHYVTFEDWKILNEIEIKRGSEKGKSRDKLTNIAQMLKIVNKKQHEK